MNGFQGKPKDGDEDGGGGTRYWLELDDRDRSIELTTEAVFDIVPVLVALLAIIFEDIAWYCPGRFNGNGEDKAPRGGVIPVMKGCCKAAPAVILYSTNIRYYHEDVISIDVR